ncbi:MAG: FecR domain-containing protein [Colwellia sp.]
MNDNISGFTNTTKINQEAAEWILLIEDTDKLSKQQIDNLNKWIALSDVHKKCITQMANSWGEMDVLTSILSPKAVKDHAISLIDILQLPFIVLLRSISHLYQSVFMKKVSVLAMSLVFVAGGWQLFNKNTMDFNPNNANVLTTVLGQHSNHKLADGSTVWLNSATKIKIDYSDNFRRIYLLEGEAYFEVAKNANRPFEVYSDNRLVRAVGTAFSVQKLNDSIKVLVTEGKVELAVVDNILHIKDKTPSSSIVAEPSTTLLRGKTIGYLTAGQSISIPTVDNVKIGDANTIDFSDINRNISWRDGKLVFAGESLEEVIKEITRHTNMKIDIRDAELKKMRIGGQFLIGDTDSLFNVLESGFGIDVVKLDQNHVQLHIKK